MFSQHPSEVHNVQKTLKRRKNNVLCHHNKGYGRDITMWNIIILICHVNGKKNVINDFQKYIMSSNITEETSFFKHN